MKIKGPKKLVKRAKFMARLLKVKGFILKISWTDSGSYCCRLPTGIFKIKINRLRGDYALNEVVAHEMVHLAQYVTGRLADGPDNWVIWEGKRYKEPVYCSTQYWLAPWEMEARGFEAYADWCWRNR